MILGTEVTTGQYFDRATTADVVGRHGIIFYTSFSFYDKK